jgi:hypothetical protein
MVIPAAGGGYLRQLPYGLMKRGFAQARASGSPGMFYVHPWELDPDQPRLPVSPITRVRHYRGLARTESILERLLGEVSFTSVKTRISGLQPPPGSKLG